MHLCPRTNVEIFALRVDARAMCLRGRDFLLYRTICGIPIRCSDLYCGSQYRCVGVDVNVASLELCNKLLNKAELVFDQQAASNKGSHRAWDNGHASRQWNQWGYKRQGDFAGASSSKRPR